MFTPSSALPLVEGAGGVCADEVALDAVAHRVACISIPSGKRLIDEAPDHAASGDAA